jgi:hypothetical protein
VIRTVSGRAKVESDPQAEITGQVGEIMGRKRPRLCTDARLQAGKKRQPSPPTGSSSPRVFHLIAP